MRNYRSLFPNSFTMGNMMCGFLSILSTLEGNAITAAWLIVLGAFLDSLDGKVARLTKVTSRFGVELDSLSDFLTFGVSTGVLLYAFKFHDMGRWGWIVSGVYVMCAGFRLARYNLLATLEEKKSFLGLPVPVASMLLVSYVIFSYEMWGGIEYGEFLISLMAGASLLMVSTVEYETFPDNLRSVESRVKFLLLFIFLIALIIKPRLVMFPAVLAYVLSCLVRDVMLMLKREAFNTEENNRWRKKEPKRHDKGNSKS
ncbi:MAG: CDP-diacylglycerol--serine O-phosphatidyltransferase [candidate division Zixibacteria bacterium]|nr:CDP-diacylglycerol--serine O-phosphatidyltransferase [candidate division Zixibacteria bacterium]MBU1471735.1 CDP-diacylglycerol--serine O-phosphatidyltransferase [candidate division Zixibacteria bacterium]MBU2625167.1 CDP-diacylglycerol--serine O-phosphatidyltransferase [candidate division Zixibacteria bacterium]